MASAVKALGLRLEMEDLALLERPAPRPKPLFKKDDVVIRQEPTASEGSEPQPRKRTRPKGPDPHTGASSTTQATGSAPEHHTVSIEYPPEWISERETWRYACVGSSLCGDVAKFSMDEAELQAFGRISLASLHRTSSVHCQAGIRTFPTSSAHCQVYDVERDPEHPIGRCLVPFRSLNIAAKHEAEARERLNEDPSNPFLSEELKALGLPIVEAPDGPAPSLPYRWLKLPETEGPWADAARTLETALKQGTDLRVAATNAVQELLKAVNRKRTFDDGE